jgi:site-specific DNA-cytosine methylase
MTNPIFDTQTYKQLGNAIVAVVVAVAVEAIARQRFKNI